MTPDPSDPLPSPAVPRRRGAPLGSRNAAKPPDAELRDRPIYLRATASERAEIMAWAAGRKITTLSVETLLAVSRLCRESPPSGPPDPAALAHLLTIARRAPPATAAP